MDKETDKHKYDDIIGLPHHVSATRPRMPMMNRAAQFAPFAALRGHSDAIEEAERNTTDRVDLEWDSMAELDRKLAIALDVPGKNPLLKITYFCPDERKAGGEYAVATGRIKRVLPNEGRLELAGGVSIPLEDIRDIQGEIFGDLF